MSMIPKHQMSEEDIKLQFITPAVTAKWNIGKITMETKLTDGKINLKGNFVVREKPKRADYVLYLAPNYPIAIIEAKDNNHSTRTVVKRYCPFLIPVSPCLPSPSRPSPSSHHQFSHHQPLIRLFPSPSSPYSVFHQNSPKFPTQ